MAPPTYGLVLDIQASQRPGSMGRGIGRFVVEHARSLISQPGLVRQLAINPLRPFPGHLPRELLTSPLLSWDTATALRRVEHDGPFAYYVMSPFELHVSRESLLPPHTMSPQIPFVVTLYDLIPLVMADHYLQDRNTAVRYKARLELVRHADLVLATSEHTRRDAIRLLGLDPERVVFIGGGVSPWFHPRLSEADPGDEILSPLPRINRPFVLCVSGADDRKNTEALITAFAQLAPSTRADHQLVITSSGSPEFESKWRRHAQRVGLARDELILTDYVSDHLLRALYQTATVSVVPSLQEGFGLPIAEAISCGCPTLCSNSTSLPEILDWTPSTFDPTSPTAIANSIERALSDHGFREELKAIGLQRASLYTWEAVGLRTASALDRLRSPHRTFRRSRRKFRIAVVGPLPPTRSGIAPYNARLIELLSIRSDLDIYSEHGSSYASFTDAPCVRHLPTTSLGDRYNPASYDAIIYTVGNSEHHHRTYELARRWPGIVWFHDVQFRGFDRSLGQAPNPSDMHALINAKLIEQYGQRVPAEVLGTFSSEHESRFGLRLTADWISNARAVIVPSCFAEHVLRMVQGPNVQLPPVVTIPLAIPSFANDDHIVRDVPPIIASFGHVAPETFPEKLIDALGRVRAKVPARLVFVGPVEDGFQGYLEQYAADLGLAEHVEFTGELSELAYQRWLWRATSAVQLRNATNGEISGAVVDCVAAGLPVVTNLLGVAEGYVPDAIVSLDPLFSLDELAARLTELITDSKVWERHHVAAQRQAPRWTFANVAAELIRVVASFDKDRVPGWRHCR